MYRSAALTQTLPVLPLRDIVVFPQMIVPLFVGRDKSVAALETAMAADKQIFLVSQLDPSEDDPDRDALYDIGVIATVLQLLKLPDGTVRVLVEGAAARQSRQPDERGRPSRRRCRTGRRSPSSEGPEIRRFDALGRRSVRKLCEAQQEAARRDRGPARPDRGCRRASPTRSRATSRSRSPTSRRCWSSSIRPPAGDGLRLHGGRARRAAGREEDPQSRVKRQMEKTQREYYLERAVEGDPARARQ